MFNKRKPSGRRKGRNDNVGPAVVVDVAHGHALTPAGNRKHGVADTLAHVIRLHKRSGRVRIKRKQEFNGSRRCWPNHQVCLAIAIEVANVQ